MKIPRTLQTHTDHLASVISHAQTGMMHDQTKCGMFNPSNMFFKRESNWNIKMELTVVSCSLNPGHWVASHWTQQSEIQTSHVTVHSLLSLLVWMQSWFTDKKNQNKLATTLLSRSVTLTTGKVCLSNQSKCRNQRHFFSSPFYT